MVAAGLSLRGSSSYMDLCTLLYGPIRGEPSSQSQNQQYPVCNKIGNVGLEHLAWPLDQACREQEHDEYGAYTCQGA